MSKYLRELFFRINLWINNRNQKGITLIILIFNIFKVNDAMKDDFKDL